MSVRIIGDTRLKANLLKLSNEIDPLTVRELKRIAEAIKKDAKAMCPVDTGSLRSSIRRGAYAMPAMHTHSIRVTAGGYITNPKTKRKVDYASHVEFGTSRSRAQPFLRPAYEKHKKELLPAISRGMLRMMS